MFHIFFQLGIPWHDKDKCKILLKDKYGFNDIDITTRYKAQLMEIMSLQEIKNEIRIISNNFKFGKKVNQYYVTNCQG